MYKTVSREQFAQARDMVPSKNSVVNKCSTPVLCTLRSKQVVVESGTGLVEEKWHRGLDGRKTAQGSEELLYSSFNVVLIT